MIQETDTSEHDELLDRFLQQLEQADDPAIVLHGACECHPNLAAEFTALADSHRLLARVRPDTEPPLPPRLGDFHIIHKIAWGGMGNVYEAVQEPFQRRVAVKTIRPMHVSAPVRERFLREQQVLADLHQTHIVPIFAAGCVGDTHYFAMPYLHGATLQEILRNERLSLATGAKPPLGGTHGSAVYFRSVAALLADAADAIAHAHERGILHRDLKPANLMVADDGHVWILDFGLAGYLAAEERDRQVQNSQASPDEPTGLSSGLTTPGSIPGTLDYMAPEQLDGSADARTDVWGLGVVFYELLTLHRAYENRPPSDGQELGAGENARSRRRQELTQPLTLPRQAVPHLPRDLDAICSRCLQTDPAARYASAQALAEDLRSFLRDEESQARAWNSGERLLRWCRRHPTQVGYMVITALLLGAAVLAGYTWQLRTSNVRNAEKLARSVAVQFDLVKQAVSITVQHEKLRHLLDQFKGDPDNLREPLRGFLRETQADFNQWFAQSGQEPLVNLLVFDPEGTLLADSLVNNHASEGKNYADRDYYTGLLRDPDRGAVYVSRVYVSFEDNKYKLAVITRIWDGERCIGLLAATLPISSKLVVLDMRDEPVGAGLACPMDWTYPERHAVPADQQHEQVFVLHAGYRVPSNDPKWAASQTLGELVRDHKSNQAADYFTADACFTDYVRVGESDFVVIIKQSYSWPIFFLLLLGLVLVLGASWRLVLAPLRGRRHHPAIAPPAAPVSP